MPGELKFKFSFEYRKGSGKPQKVRSSQTITVTGNNVRGLAIQSVGTTKENLDKPSDMGTIGWAYLHNLDPTNFVSFGDDADSPSLILKATEETFVRWGATNISACADSAALDVESLLIED